jgi:S-adenosyl-L-methionine-dependent methyltransferase
LCKVAKKCHKDSQNDSVCPWVDRLKPLHHDGKFMSEAPYELVTLRGGFHSIRSVAHGETMHIGTDPRTEAMELHVGQQRLAERVAAGTGANPFVVWDIGLGPAGNALAAMEALKENSHPVEIHSFEIDTEVLEFALKHADALSYLKGWERVVGQFLAEGEAQPTPLIRWRLHRGDFSRSRPEAPAPSAIFFDPYSPSRNAEMWSMETFQMIHDVASGEGTPDCMMTNYTRSTSVRVTMLLAGWFVGTGVPTGEKEETTIAANRPGLLEKPLDHAWLSRVRSSTNAAPLQGRNYDRGPISPEDYARLIAHPQFA